MIIISGKLFSSDITINIEGDYKTSTCAAVQKKLQDVFDVTRVQGCPDKCPFSNSEVCDLSAVTSTKVKTEVA